jgi:hypothetical protein
LAIQASANIILKCSVQDDLVKPILINVMLYIRRVQKKLFSSFSASIFFSIGYFQLDRLHFLSPFLVVFVFQVLEFRFLFIWAFLCLLVHGLGQWAQQPKFFDHLTLFFIIF